jgi:cytochrome c oxidase subunit 2
MVERYLLAASTYASHIDNLINLIGVMVGFWFFLCVGAFFYLIFKFKAKEGVPAEYVDGTNPNHKRWVSWPHYLVLVCDVFILIGAVQVWYEIKQDLPPAQETVRIVGQQWAWSFVHPGPDGELDTADDIKTVDDLHLKVDTLYHYQLEARDVMHSFSIPVFRLKQDAIPGRVITGWFEPTVTGEWDLQCAEICGIGHGVMAARVSVESNADHEAWMAQYAPATGQTISLAAATPAQPITEN